MSHKDVFTFIHIPYLITKLINPIIPSSIDSGNMEEGGICISFSEPGYSGFSFLEILLTF